ncbi:MAG: transcriptional regulator [Phycisphaeraceae bacterium]|nr:transcriptional regulator [Phycisphaeraceae bacterium]|tara:strand:+ start:598 stop:933 length:336 start_codon:yes stop_codon:yes gene_type:complete
MKKVEAFVKSIRLSQVMLALHHVEGLSGASITQATGFGRGHGPDGRSAHEVSDLNPIVRIEVYCADELVDQIVSAIEEKAHTGLRGDGKIYVSSIEQAVRISTGERDQNAI